MWAFSLQNFLLDKICVTHLNSFSKMKHIEVRARVCIFVSPWNVSTRLLAHSRIYNNINANNFHRWTKKISVVTAVFSLSLFTWYRFCVFIEGGVWHVYWLHWECMCGCLQGIFVNNSRDMLRIGGWWWMRWMKKCLLNTDD